MSGFVLATTCDSRLEADLLKAYLEMENIEVMIQSDDAGGMLPSLSLMSGVFLFVPEDDLNRTLKFLAAYKNNEKLPPFA